MRTTWGVINADRTIKSGSGDFKVDESGAKGTYSVLFDTPFGDIPAVTVTPQESASSYSLIMELNQLDDSQFTVKIRSAHSWDAYDRDFAFIAVGIE
jgi:hypothetical protein